MSPILDAVLPPVNSGSDPVRPKVTPAHAAGSDHLVLPPSRRSLAEIQSDDSLSNGARRLAAYLDGRCLAYGKWAAWSKVSTIAEAMGWGGKPRAFRKRVERYFRELIASGDVARPRLWEVVAWYDSEGAGRGFAWLAGLRRNLCRTQVITVLGWKLAEAEERLPSLTPCDIPVAWSAPPGDLPTPPNVACHPPEMSHGDTPEMSHPQNVRTLNVPTETTLDDVSALASPEGEEEPTMATEPTATATVAGHPAAPAPVPDYNREQRARSLVRDFIGRNFVVSPDGSLDLAPAMLGLVARGFAFPPTDEDRAALASLLPEVLAIWYPARSPVPPPPPSTSPKTEGSGRAAPKVPPGVRANVRAKIARLSVPGATNSDVSEAARVLVSALGPHKDHDRTVAKFVWICGQLRKGSMSQDTVQDAFEKACGKKAESRGAMFNHFVKNPGGVPAA